VIVVHTLDRLGRTVRDTLNLSHDLSERGLGVRNLADPIKVDSTNPADPTAQLAVVLLALFAQIERTYTLGRRPGRPPASGAGSRPAVPWPAPGRSPPADCGRCRPPAAPPHQGEEPRQDARRSGLRS